MQASAEYSDYIPSPLNLHSRCQTLPLPHLTLLTPSGEIDPQYRYFYVEDTIESAGPQSPPGCIGSNPQVQIMLDRDDQGSYEDCWGRFEIAVSKGGRKHMEDTFTAIPEIGDASTAFFGVFDGHGKKRSGYGRRCSDFCAEQLTDFFNKLDESWKENVEQSFFR